MMKSPICSVLSKASWVITALASINVGLALFGVSIFEHPFFLENFSMLIMPLVAIIGLAGVWSLVHFFMDRSSCCQ